jgi:hypothetical protein
MKARWIFLAMCLVISGFIAWATGVFAGRPCLPLSDAKGTERIFAANDSEVRTAISNAFNQFKYHDLMLTDPIGSDWLAPGWHPTNGFLLLPTVGIVGMVPTIGILGKRELPYVATFHITVDALAANQTRVVVRTVIAKVVDGVALGHGGTPGNTKRVPPVRQEEENVLSAIAEQLNGPHNHSEERTGASHLAQLGFLAQLAAGSSRSR